MLSLIRLNASYIMQKEIMKVALSLEDFEVLDLWSKSKKWSRLIEAREDVVERMSDCSDMRKAPQALIIEYSTIENGACPYHLKCRSEKQLFIVALIPLLNELQRTMNAAFEN
mmetsp:Transcript_10734/g.16327  ORF Transcript_10734/g.16327 Transcript_10734/m.16327 type:complete len:113 (+) Transcript_10734:1814-2152(+)